VRPAALTRVRRRTPWVRATIAIPPVGRAAAAIPPVGWAAAFERAGRGGGWRRSSELGASKGGVPIPPMGRAAPVDLAGAVGSEATSAWREWGESSGRNRLGVCNFLSV
jgi:hypothetical protein